jgi:hypothetical protein
MKVLTFEPGPGARHVAVAQLRGMLPLVQCLDSVQTRVSAKGTRDEPVCCFDFLGDAAFFLALH